MPVDYEWKRFGYALRDAESEMKDYAYQGIFDAPPFEKDFGLPSGTLAWKRIGRILSKSGIGPPHGLDLLSPPPQRELPTVPAMPDIGRQKFYDDYTRRRFDELTCTVTNLREEIARKRAEDVVRAQEVAIACELGNVAAAQCLILLSLRRHPLPEPLVLQSEVLIDKVSRVALCTIEIPDFARLPLLKQKGKGWGNWGPVSALDRRRGVQTVLRSLCVRAAYLTAMSDPAELYDTVAVNAWQSWFDPATGAPRQGTVASLQASKYTLRGLNPDHLDADACFKHLSGIQTPDVTRVTPIRPVCVLDKADDRIVANRSVDESLSSDANVAAMPWEDFEHLVRQLFEWMFHKEGVEVSVTRASRDRGVDAIAFDPDPIRGGKYVIQAKRYTKPVEVAAVRDLYGTIMNEGANRGILVTTSSFGADAYDFAKDKPISLVDGPNLIVLLKRYGNKEYRIELEEARRLAGLGEGG